MDGMQPPQQQQQAAPEGGAQQGGPSTEELVKGTAQAMAALAAKAEQDGANPEQISALKGVLDQFVQVASAMMGGGGQKQASQTVSPEGGVQGQPMSPAGV